MFVLHCHIHSIVPTLSKLSLHPSNLENGKLAKLTDFIDQSIAGQLQCLHICHHE